VITYVYIRPLLHLLIEHAIIYCMPGFLSPTAHNDWCCKGLTVKDIAWLFRKERVKKHWIHMCSNRNSFPAERKIFQGKIIFSGDKTISQEKKMFV
jgi:hypothetical protein